MNAEKIFKKYALKLYLMYLMQSSIENVWNQIKLINIKLCRSVLPTVMEGVLTTVSFGNLGQTAEAVITEGYDVLALRNDEGHDFTWPIPAASSSAMFERQFTLTYALIY